MEQGIHSILVEIYEHNPDCIILQHRHSNMNYARKILKPFQLYGPEGQPILPRVWSRTINPSDLITMRFHEERLNGSGAHPVTLSGMAVQWIKRWWKGNPVNIRTKLARSEFQGDDITETSSSVLSSSSSSSWGPEERVVED